MQGHNRAAISVAWVPRISNTTAPMVAHVSAGPYEGATTLGSAGGGHGVAIGVPGRLGAGVVVGLLIEEGGVEQRPVGVVSVALTHPSRESGTEPLLTP